MKKLITLSEKVDLLAIAYNLNGGVFVMQEAYELIEYKRFIDQPLTKEMFEGDKAIFVGFENITKGNDFTIYSNGFLDVYFQYMMNGCINSFCCSSDPIINDTERIDTLHDLAELTKENQLELK